MEGLLAKIEELQAELRRQVERARDERDQVSPLGSMRDAARRLVDEYLKRGGFAPPDELSAALEALLVEEMAQRAPKDAQTKSERLAWAYRALGLGRTVDQRNHGARFKRVREALDHLSTMFREVAS